MKIIRIVLGTILVIAASGCTCPYDSDSGGSASASTSQPATVSNDGYTWKLGAVTVDGTNVPMTAVEVRPATSGAPR